MSCFFKLNVIAAAYKGKSSIVNLVTVNFNRSKTL